MRQREKVSRLSELATARLLRRAEDADRLEERLRRLEWSSSRPTSWGLRSLLWLRLGWGNCCPVCELTAATGHADGCWLGEELQRGR